MGLILLISGAIGAETFIIMFAKERNWYYLAGAFYALSVLFHGASLI